MSQAVKIAWSKLEVGSGWDDDLFTFDRPSQPYAKTYTKKMWQIYVNNLDSRQQIITNLYVANMKMRECFQLLELPLSLVTCLQHIYCDMFHAIAIPR